MVNIQETFQNIKSQTFNMQKTLKACEKSFTQVLDEGSSKKLIEYLIINLDEIRSETTETVKYTTKLNWVLTAEEIIIYVLLSFYDLKQLTTVEKCLLQFEKELETHSSYDAKNRIKFLLKGEK